MLPSYVVPIAVGLVVVASIIALPKILGRRVESSSSPSASNAARAAARSGNEPSDAEDSRGANAKPNASSSSRGSSPNSSKSAAPVRSSAKDVSHAPAASPAPATLRTETKASPDAAKRSAPDSGASANDTSGKGEVLDQVLPDPPEKALATINGKVRITVLAHVNPSGNVTDADFTDPGPSKYFADLAVKAVRRWEFNSPEVNGRSVPSEWEIRFEFTSAGVQAFPKQVTP